MPLLLCNLTHLLLYIMIPHFYSIINNFRAFGEEIFLNFTLSTFHFTLKKAALQSSLFIQLIASFGVAVDGSRRLLARGRDLVLKEAVVELLVDGKIDFTSEPIRKMHRVRDHKSADSLASVSYELAAVQNRIGKSRYPGALCIMSSFHVGNRGFILGTAISGRSGSDCRT